MSTTSSTAPTSSPSSNLNPETCVSLASNLRCYYTGQSTEIHHVLLIIPVAIELIFSTSLIFTNWRSGRRHLLLVAEGWVIFLLSLVEVFLFTLPAVRESIPIFRAVDQSVGALSFIQLFFYMSFLFVWVQGECLPSVPRRIRQIARLLLLIFIPAIITMNMIASFVGVSYDPGPQHVRVTFRDPRARFVWPFFSSVTLALFTVFQASCFIFAFYRLIRAVLVQRQIEVESKDAAVLFKGIGWINIGIKIGAIETVVGFVFFGVPIAYVRRVLRMFSRAFLCVGIAKGVDETEDFKAFRDELESRSSGGSSQRPKLREFISNPRLSTFRQLSPTATAFHTAPRAPAIDYNIYASLSEKPHPYAASALLAAGKRDSIYDQSAMHENKELLTPASISKSFTASPKLSMFTGLPGMTDFAEIRAKRLSERSPSRVTVLYNHGTPTLHLRFSHVELPTPAFIAQSIKSRSSSEDDRNEDTVTAHSQLQSRSSFNMTPRGLGLYDASSMYARSDGHGHAPVSGTASKRGSLSYSYFTSSPSSGLMTASPGTFGQNRTPTVATHSHHQNSGRSSFEFEPPTPAYLNGSTRRLSDTSEASNISAAQAEIVDTPRRKLSFKKPKSALARAVLYPVPGTNVAMALAGEDLAPTSLSPPRRLQKPRPASPKSDRTVQPISQRPSPSRSPSPGRQSPIPAPSPPSRPAQQREDPIVRESIIDEDGKVIVATAIAPSIEEEDYDSDGKPGKRTTRALSGYSVGSVPETLQAVRELARKFPGPPAGAVVADIGFLASAMAPVKEKDEVSSIGGRGRIHDERRRSMDSMDTVEMLRKRIPAEMKMKGRAEHNPPDIPLPPIPGDEVQRLPASLPARSALRQQPPRQPPRQPPISEAPVQADITPDPIDPFDDDTSFTATSSELSPLSMSVKLRHPQSFISTMFPPTRRNSGTTTGLTSPVTPFSLTYIQNPSVFRSDQPGSTPPTVLDFGTALKEWNAAQQKTLEARPINDLPSTRMIKGHRRSLSAQTRAEFDKQEKRQQIGGITSYDIGIADDFPEQFDQSRSRNIAPVGGPLKLNRIKSIGKAPRRFTPQPTRGRHFRESLHLQPLVIPVSSSSGRDVPLSAVGAGGFQTILGVNRAGMNVDIAQEQEDAETVMSATTDGARSSNGRGIVWYPEALSVEDGGYFPMRLQR